MKYVTHKKSGSARPLNKRKSGRHNKRVKKVRSGGQATAQRLPGWLPLAGLIAVLVITFMLYHQVSDYYFIHYDDPSHIVDNEDIRDFSLQGAYNIFFHPFNPELLAPPLTILSFAMNYHFSDLDPGPYHMTNVFLHLLNVLMVFLLVWKVMNNRWAALFVSAVFALHPLNTEAVCWVTARKDLLYGFFFLLALWLAIRFWQTRNGWLYAGAIAAFVLSYFSKFSAATFPVVYLGLALLWKNRKDIWRVVAESIPFLLLPGYTFYRVIFPDAPKIFPRADYNPGITYFSEKFEIVTHYHDFSFIQKIFLGGYSFITYLIKFLLPVNQQIIYPYPDLSPSGHLPLVYYLATIASVLLVSAVVYYFIKNPSRLTTTPGFIMVFYLATTSVLLHVLPIGGRAVVADRYGYIPFIALAMLLFYLGLQLKRRRRLKPSPLILAGLLWLFVLIIATAHRIPMWKNTGTILTDLTEKEPSYPIAYYNLGFYYAENNQKDRALRNYTRALKLAPHFTQALNNRAAIYMISGQYQKAKPDIQRFIELLPHADPTKYQNLGQIYREEGDYDKALEYYQKAVEMNPQIHNAWYNIAYILITTGKHQEALKPLKQAINLRPRNAQNYVAQGMAYVGMEQYEKALSDFKKAISLDSSNLEAHINKARVNFNFHQFREAIQTYTYILENISPIPDQGSIHLNRAFALMNLGQRQEACADFFRAAKHGKPTAQDYINRYCR